MPKRTTPELERFGKIIRKHCGDGLMLNATSDEMLAAVEEWIGPDEARPAKARPRRRAEND